jgi:outer membrane protein OmpA-like peptidoglycan-associated protein
MFWVVSTPRADYRVVQNRGSTGRVPDDAAARTRNIWFFARVQLLAQTPDVVSEAFKLARQLGFSTNLPIHRVTNELVQFLETAIWLGTLVFEERALPPLGPALDGVTQQSLAPASVQPPAMPVTATPTAFAVQWVDEIGMPISGLDVVFSVSGQRQNGVTGGDGTARFTDPSGSNFGFADPASLTGVRDAVGPRWNTIRPGEPLTEADALVFHLRDTMGALQLQADTLRTISVQPFVSRQRLIGGYFDTSKAFILPHGLCGVRAIVSEYASDPNAKLLIVGHTDLAGTPECNDPLSVERAESLKDYLTDNVDGWLKWYGQVPFEKRWGPKEDQLMVGALPDASTHAPNEAPVPWFQRTRGLTVDGIAGPQTRRQLIKEYMALDGTSLPPGIEATIHGCGENFPDDVTADGIGDPDNRRVEVFFFDDVLGIQPPPPGPISGPGSTEYPEWVKRTRRTNDHVAHEGPQLLALRLHAGDRSPMANASASVVTGGGPKALMLADSDGFVFVLLPASCPDSIRVEWGPTGTTANFPFTCEVVVDCDAGDRSRQDRTRLHNLGYPLDLPFEVAAKVFQIDYKVDYQPQPIGLTGGQLPDASHELLSQIFEGNCDASRS